MGHIWKATRDGLSNMMRSWWAPGIANQIHTCTTNHLTQRLCMWLSISTCIDNKTQPALKRCDARIGWVQRLTCPSVRRSVRPAGWRSQAQLPAIISVVVCTNDNNYSSISGWLILHSLDFFLQHSQFSCQVHVKLVYSNTITFHTSCVYLCSLSSAWVLDGPQSCRHDSLALAIFTGWACKTWLHNFILQNNLIANCLIQLKRTTLWCGIQG